MCNSLKFIGSTYCFLSASLLVNNFDANYVDKKYILDENMMQISNQIFRYITQIIDWTA